MKKPFSCLPLLLLLTLTLAGFAATAQRRDTAYSRADTQYLNQQNALEGESLTCTCKTRPPYTIIYPPLANRRIKAYQNKLNDCNLKLASEVTYSIDGAFNLLTKMTTNSTKTYDGYRAYFAVYPDSNQVNPTDSGFNFVPEHQGGKLTVIYVPTTTEGTYMLDGEPHIRHVDDTMNCMLINGDLIETLSPKFASWWINKAQNGPLAAMENRQRHHCFFKKFNETHNLWYDMKFVKYNPKDNNGLLDILKCRKQCYPMAQVHAKFASYPDVNLKGYKKKISLIFQVDKGPKSDYISLFSYDLSHWAKYAYENEYGVKFTSNDSGSDTGKPCPPPSPCGSGVGVLMPNQ